MTYTPTAYTQQFDTKWWIFMKTPSGTVVRLHTTYENQSKAVEAIQFLGFALVRPPAITFANLNRGNTTPR